MVLAVLEMELCVTAMLSFGAFLVWEWELETGYREKNETSWYHASRDLGIQWVEARHGKSGIK